MTLMSMRKAARASRLAFEPLERRQLLNAGSVIHEIMYHPASENDLEEYIELYNPTASDVDLTGWRISDGVQYDFPSVNLGAGQYLVVAADVATFSAKYPGVANVVGGWSGQLSDRGERIELLDAAGVVADELQYADEGDWGTRAVGPDDLGHTGWIWLDEHDGGGRSLELVNTALSNEFGQNWAASLLDQGTPGAANSVVAANSAPLILDVAHAPLIPRATDTVTVTARLLDELPTGSTATLHWRVDGQPAFNQIALRDDGTGGDARGGDNIFTGAIPAQADGSVVEFYVAAGDAALNGRTWPAPIAPTGEQLANALYQVEDSFDPAAGWTPGDQPIYRLILTEAERAELADIGDGSGGDADSNAQMNGTFIAIDGNSVESRYNVAVRNRGHGSRDDPPNNYRVNFANDRPLDGVPEANINSKYVHSQLIGSVVFRMAGLAAADAHAVQVRVNGQDLAEQGGPRMFGSYVHVEPINSDFAENHFPLDSEGNLYRNFRTDTLPRQEADLRYEGTNPDSYRDTYFKATNEEQDDWSDIIRLTDVLNNAPEVNFLQAVSRVIDVRQWLRYIALDSLLQNRETGLNRGIGDDYAFYRGLVDTRFRLIPHDLDTVMGQGNNVGPIDQSIFSAAAVAGLNRLLTHPDTVPLFFQSFIDLIDELFNPQVMNPLLDQVLGGFVPQSRIDAMKQFVVDRSAAVLAQIPQAFTIQSTLPVFGGYHRTSNPAVALSGVANAVATRSVLVAGVPVSYSPRDGAWSTSDVGGGQVTTLVSRGSTWKYVDNGSDQGAAWRQPRFNDATWQAGPAQLGYGDGDESTTVASGPAGSHYFTTYFRHAFEVAGASQLSSLTLRLLRDDGAVVYLNGEEMFRSNMPDPPEVIDYQTPASSTVSGNAEDTFFEFALDPAGLVDGTNVLAVEIHQRDADSSDISFDLEMEGVIPSAGDSDILLNPGLNRVLVETFDGPAGTGRRLESDYIDIWYDGPAAKQTITYDPPQAASLELIVRDSYLPGVPVMVRVAALDAAGNPLRELWDATVQLTTDRHDVGLSTYEIQLRNGLGSALIDVDASGDFTLTAALGQVQLSRGLISLTGAPVAEVSGALPGAATNWSGVIHVTGDLLVPVGHTLTIQPGTLILLDGNSAPLTSDGADIDVRGTLNSLGTAVAPVTFTAADPTAPWGEIHHDDAAPSLYQYTHITRAGHAPRGGHTNTGPAIRTVGSTITFDHTSITDTAGKIMQGTSSVLEFYDSHFARSVMGPEVAGTSVLFQDSYILDMRGIYREDGVVDDDDGFYVHRQAGGQEIKFLRAVVAGADDDGIDSLNADVIIEDTIVRDITDKGVSYIEGANTIRNTLIAGADIGVSAKGQSGGSPVSNNTWDHVTIVARSIGVQAEDKFGIPGAVINYDIANSIIQAPDAVRTDYDPATILIDYTNLSEPWPGVGNFNQNPRFADPSRGDFRLQPGSSSIDAGDPAAALDADGTRADLGAFTSGVSGVFAPTLLDAVTLTADTILTPWGGPYTINGAVTVDAGATLYVLPGTSVYFTQGAELEVHGQLQAAGTKHQRIRLTGVPGAALVPDIRPELPAGPPKWQGIHVVDSTSADNLISFADVEYAQSSGGAVFVENSEAVLDNLSFFGTRLRMVHTENASLILRNSVFPDMFLPTDSPSTMTPPLDNISEHVNVRGGIPAGGHVLIEHNVFGTNKGHNDVIDIDSNRWPDPVAMIRNNVFLGGGDEAIDGGGDILIEGNLFLNFQKDADNTGGGDSNVITTGDVRTSTLVIVRNTFVNVDHVVNFKNDSYGYFENNTVVGITPPHMSLPDDPPPRMLDFSVINFLIPNVNDPQNGNPRNPAGIGAYTAGNIMVDVPQTVFGHVDMDPPGNPDFTSILEVWHSLVGDPTVFANADGIHNRMFQYLVGAPRFVNAAAGDYRLAPGSPALGTGPNGLDMGAHVPAGASISGEPPALTAADHATLTIGGPGIFSFIYRVNDGPWSEEIQITDPSDVAAPTKTRQYDLALGGLADGQYTVYVRGRDFAGQLQPTPTASKTWTVNTSMPRLLINEVLADNAGAVEHHGTTPDMIELVNAGATPVNLRGLSISDTHRPGQFIFQSDTILMPGEYLVIYADSAATPGLHLGFALDADGDGVFLFDGSSIIAGLIDSVEFGPQIAGLSIGRAGHDRQWTLTHPTMGADNAAHRLGNPQTLMINEWFTGGDIVLAVDFVELFNPDPLPVALGGLYLTDDPIARPDRHEIAPLSFIAGGGQTAFIADGDPQSGAQHVDFKLSADQEMIGLFTAGLSEIDKIIYFSQTDEYSQGRKPDGAQAYEFFALPTPGAASPPPERVTALFADLRITEIMYHPVEGTDTEFIELQNTGSQALDLTGVRLDGGVRFTFPQYSLAPGAYVVVVNNLPAFQARHPGVTNVAGQFDGNLSNGGEDLVLQLPEPYDAAMLRFDYDDAWYPTTDGDGLALVIRDATARPPVWNTAAGWQAGGLVGGSPGRGDGDPPPVLGDTNGDGRVDIDDLNSVRNNFGSTKPGTPGDTNGDGRVDIDDSNNVRNNFGAGPAALAAPQTLSSRATTIPTRSPSARTARLRFSAAAVDRLLATNAAADSPLRSRVRSLLMTPEQAHADDSPPTSSSNDSPSCRFSRCDLSG